MKTSEIDLSGDDETEVEGLGFLDHRGSIENVLEIVDEQLAAHGLEIEVFDTGSDEYAWRIVKR